MADRLDVKQTVALTSHDREALRREADRLGAGHGLYARVLLLSALDRSEDPEIVAAVEREKSAERERAKEAARKNIAHRWRTTKEDNS